MQQKNIGWRLDYILSSQSAAEVLAQTGTSDHAPVVAELL
jgi:exonuclease III